MHFKCVLVFFNLQMSNCVRSLKCCGSVMMLIHKEPLVARSWVFHLLEKKLYSVYKKLTWSQSIQRRLKASITNRLGQTDFSEVVIVGCFGFFLFCFLQLLLPCIWFKIWPNICFGDVGNISDIWGWNT